jgi:hypothetical protein
MFILTWLEAAIGIRSSLAGRHEAPGGGSLRDAPALLPRELGVRDVASRSNVDATAYATIIMLESSSEVEDSLPSTAKRVMLTWHFYV